MIKELLETKTLSEFIKLSFGIHIDKHLDPLDLFHLCKWNSVMFLERKKWEFAIHRHFRVDAFATDYSDWSSRIWLRAKDFDVLKHLVDLGYNIEFDVSERIIIENPDNYKTTEIFTDPKYVNLKKFIELSTSRN